MKSTLAVLVALGLAVGATPADAAPSERALVAKERKIKRLLKKKGLTRQFHVMRLSPFIVVGDEAPARVVRRAQRTVAASTARLKRLFGWKDPNRVLEIWLFKDAISYRHHAKVLHNDNPGTPYGYYSPAPGALIMNISTGGGTLVHELVHPYIEHNFPKCPAWFNEGLGSLFEASLYQGQLIRGTTNWRLPGLQKAIRRGVTHSFRDLLATTTDEFYEGRASNYAQARYLMYYLQETGKLTEYYKAFRRDHKRDPSGYRTLKRVLGKKEKDMAAFEKEWERWVLKLRQ